MHDECPTPTPIPIPQQTVAAFARELRCLATQVERDLARNEHVSALSALTAIKPLTGALADAALTQVVNVTNALNVLDPASTPPSDNPCGYL